MFTLAVSIALGYDRASLRHILGIALAAAGVVYLVDPLRANFSAQTTLGNILIITNSFSFGAYIAVSRNLFRRYGALNVITWIFLIGAIVTLPLAGYAWAANGLETLSMGVWLSVAYIILVPTVGAYYLNSWAITRVPPSVVAVYIYLQPLLAFGLAPLVLGESWNSRTIVACVSNLCGGGGGNDSRSEPGSGGSFRASGRAGALSKTVSSFEFRVRVSEVRPINQVIVGSSPDL